jgi:hypothetical protein
LICSKTTRIEGSSLKGKFCNYPKGELIEYFRTFCCRIRNMNERLASVLGARGSRRELLLRFIPGAVAGASAAVAASEGTGATDFVPGDPPTLSYDNSPMSVPELTTLVGTLGGIGGGLLDEVCAINDGRAGPVPVRMGLDTATGAGLGLAIGMAIEGAAEVFSHK